MKLEPPWAGPGRVVHVVGRVTDEVIGFLGPATHALARAGLDQAVVMIDELRLRQHVSKLHESAELVLTPTRRNPITQWRDVLQACRAVLQHRDVHAIHLHGLKPCLVGTYAARAAAVQAPIFYSPHGSRSLGALGALGALGSVAMWLARPVLPTSRGAVIVNALQETRAFEHWNPAELVENPVGDAFFAVPRNEARHPLIVTGGRAPNVRAVELVAQLAVLLGGGDPHISFNWIGGVDEVSRTRLAAAGVGIFDAAADIAPAARLASGWIGLAPVRSSGFPRFLVEAMAAGLPCIALDCPQHREVIRADETGYLCVSERDMMERIAMLIDDPDLRARLGAAAQAEAQRRFGESAFALRLRTAYALPT